MQHPPQQVVQAIFDAHLTTLHEVMQGHVTDITAFTEWANRVAAQCTSTTLAFMFPLTDEQIANDHVTEYHQDWEDYEQDTQPAN